MPLKGISENPFSKGQYRATFGKNAFGGNVDCIVSDESTINSMIDWNKGQNVKISGTIDDTLMGDVKLKDCTYTVVQKTKK